MAYQLKYENGYEILCHGSWNNADVYKQGKHRFHGTVEQCATYMAALGLRRADQSSSNGGGRSSSLPDTTG